MIVEPKKGLYHAREAGWRASIGDIIVMTDADMKFPPDWVAIIEQTFSTQPVDAITGVIRYEDAPAFINWVTWATDQIYQPEGIGRFTTREYVLNGGNSAYRRDLLEAINGYRDKPHGQLEDRYISGRLHEGQYRIQLVRHLKVIHTFRRFKRNGWRGYLDYIFFYDAKKIYADHLNDEV